MPQAIHMATLPLLMLSTQAPRAEMVTISPEQVGQIFCISSLGNDMAPAGAMLSEGLAGLLDNAFVRSNAYLQAHPGDKPPLGNGVPWRTWQDYADGCTVGETSIENLVATVVINYTFSDYPDANYSNALILLPAYPEDGPPYIWRIDGVDLGGGNTLRTALAAAFEGCE